MFLTEVRRKNDDDLYLWAISLLKDLKNKDKNFTAHYIGYGQSTLGNTKIVFNNNTEIVFCFDYILKDNQKYILEQIEKYKHIKLIWIGAQKDLFNHPRIKNIFWPGDMLLQNKEYKKFNNIKKEPSNEKHWISTSLGIRPHRIYVASLLKGLGFDKYGDLRIKTISSDNKKSPLVSSKLAKGNNLAPDNISTLSLYVKGKWKLSNTKDTPLPCRIEIKFEFNPIPTADLKPLKEEMAEKYQVERWEECLVLIHQILRHQPYESYMHMGRGLILNKLNYKETACKSWRRAFELGNTESQNYIQKYCE